VGGIAPGELAAVRGRLEAFAEEVFESRPGTDQRARGACDLRGLMLEGLVKALEPTAWAVDDPASPKTVTTRSGCSVQTRARWVRRPTASSGCRSTPSPSRPAARWTGGCLCPSLGGRHLARRAACQVPERGGTGQGQLVLEMVEALEGWGLRPPVLVADAGSGEVGEFRPGLEDRGIG
jgi:DDE superfamily endonuclease